jgi:hypothetical protein
MFIAAQHIRVRHFREVLMDIVRLLAERIRAMGFEPDSVENWSMLKNEDDLKHFTAFF